MNLGEGRLLVLLAAACLWVVAIVLFGRARWSAGTRLLRSQLEGARRPIEPATFSLAELVGLPAPVMRYFGAVLRLGQPMVAAADLRHEGTFNMGEVADRWKPFRSNQRVVTQRPGFDWDARIALLPGVPVHVHDAYAAGRGRLRAAVYGLLDRVDIAGPGAFARAELMRFLAEAAWYPTALLPSQGVVWAAVDNESANATLNDGENAVTLLFRFGLDDLIDTVESAARERRVGSIVSQARWQGRFWNYAQRDGMRVPLDGEVAWLSPALRQPYWRGHMTAVAYEFAA